MAHAQPPTTFLTSLRTRGVLACSGLVLVAAFFALSHTSNGTRIAFVGPWDRSTPGELNLWLGAFVFLLPGAALLGLAAAPWLRRWFESGARALDWGTLSERRAVLAVVYLLSVCAARIGNEVFLRRLPFSDDEYGVRFGGQVLALGHLRVPMPDYFASAPRLFLHALHGKVTSMDFPGALIPWAVSELTHTGNLVFSLAAGLCPLGIAWILTRRYSLKVGIAGAALALLSPMMALLSFTTHAQVVSRGLFAAALGTLLFVEAAGFRRGLFGGLLLGAAATVRPVEIASLSLPLGLGLARDAARDRQKRPFVVGAFIGFSAGLLLVGAYDLAAAGTSLFLRMVPNEITHPYAGAFHGPFALDWYWPRFGYNVSYNALMLAVFFAGPLGILLAVAGANVDPTHRRLALGVLLALAIGLLHDDRGLHVVGPIHYSEAAVPLCVLATSGLRQLLRRVRSFGVPPFALEASWAGYLGVGLVIFTGWNALALRDQAGEQSMLYDLLDSAAPQPAVVLAPQYGSVFNSIPAGRRIGTWIFEWRRPRPDGSDPVLILNSSSFARQHLEQWFPDRSWFELVPDPATKALELHRIGGETAEERSTRGEPSIAPPGGLPSP